MAPPQRIVSNNYPRLYVSIGIAGKFSAQEYALVDTGFDGAVMVPQTVLQYDLGQPEAQAFCKVGDGRIISAPIYTGSLQLIGGLDNPWLVLPIAVMGDDYILGREVIDRFAVTFDHGKRVILKP